MKEGGNESLAGMVLDTALSRKFYEGAMTRWSQNIANLQIGMKLPLASIANLSQNVNSALLFGTRRTLKGMLTGLHSGKKPGHVLHATALTESVVSGMREAWLEPNLQTPLGKFANFVLTWSGFAYGERWNRLAAGSAALGIFLDDLAKSVEGKLRGTNLLIARRRIGQMGLSLDCRYFPGVFALLRHNHRWGRKVLGREF